MKFNIWNKFGQDVAKVENILLNVGRDVRPRVEEVQLLET